MQMGLRLGLHGRLMGGVSAYAVAGLEPELVLDFANDTYRVDGSASTFSSAVTYSGTGLRTMVDSDGLLKWAPHNLLTYSEQFDNVIWVNFRSSTTANAAVAPDGTTTADYLFHNDVSTSAGGTGVTPGGLAAGTLLKWSVFAKKAEKDFMILRTEAGTANGDTWFNLANGTVGTTGSDITSATIESMGDGWYLCSVEAAFVDTSNSTSNGRLTVYVAETDGSNTVTGSAQEGIYLWGAHLCHNSLGGMVANPDRGDSYVPTTTAAVYMPRRGNHVYNGTSWVNRGLLLESEARENLLLNSGTLSTQNVTVTAVPHTLHFTGTGTITLSGASTAGPLVGTGTGENNRVSLTFTPSAGTLTCTVTGTVTNAQLEIGSTPSSYIATSGSTVTRAAETATVAGADMPFDASGVTIQMDGLITYADEGAAGQQTFARWYAGAADYITIDLDTDSTATGEVNFNQEDTTGGAGSVASSATALAAGVNTAFNIAGRFTAAEVNGAVGGTVATADTTPTILPDLSATNFQIGQTFMGNIGKVRVWPNDLGDTGIESATS